MQQNNTKAVSRLRSELARLRGLWPGYEADLHRMGFAALADLRGRNADTLAADYCRLTGRPADPVLNLCFTAIVRFAETGEPTPWWRILRAHVKHQFKEMASAGGHDAVARDRTAGKRDARSQAKASQSAVASP